MLTRDAGGAVPAIKKLDRFRELVATTVVTGSEGDDAAAEAAAAEAEAGLFAAMNDDLNTPRAGAALFGLLKAVQPLLAAGTLPRSGGVRVAACLERFNAALGIFYALPQGYLPEAGAAGAGDVPAEVLALLEQRTVAKEARDFAGADALRAAIAAKGFDIKDAKGQPPVVIRRQ